MLVKQNLIAIRVDNTEVAWAFVFMNGFGFHQEVDAIVLFQFLVHGAGIGWIEGDDVILKHILK